MNFTKKKAIWIIVGLLAVTAVIGIPLASVEWSANAEQIFKIILLFVLTVVGVMWLWNGIEGEYRHLSWWFIVGGAISLLRVPLHLFDVTPWVRGIVSMVWTVFIVGGWYIMFTSDNE